jgi:hypothetical protein
VSLLSEITRRLEQLPEQRKLKRLNNDVQTLTAKVVETHAKLSICSSKRSYSQLVFPDEAFSKTASAVRAASRQAASLKEKLESEFNEVGTSATEKKVTRLGDKAKEADDGVAKIWPKLMQQQISPYEALADVAAKLGLPGGLVLSEIMQRLRNHVSSPPTTKEDAESIKDDLAKLRTSIEGLGLEGDAGEFLVKAAQGTADPRDLYKEDVRRFFEDQELWNLIAVKTK